MTKGLYLAPCDWLKEIALITNFKFDATFDSVIWVERSLVTRV